MVYPKARAHLGSAASGLSSAWPLAATWRGRLPPSSSSSSTPTRSDSTRRKSTPDTHAALGNFPQAFTHVGLINAALTLAEQGKAAPREINQASVRMVAGETRA
jgi:hypothetical protein